MSKESNLRAELKAAAVECRIYAEAVAQALEGFIRRPVNQVDVQSALHMASQTVSAARRVEEMVDELRLTK